MAGYQLKCQASHQEPLPPWSTSHALLPFWGDVTKRNWYQMLRQKQQRCVKYLG